MASVQLDQAKASIAKMQAQANASIDGHMRPPEAEQQINEAVHAVLATPAGDTMMAWLKSITINYVLGAQAPDAQLRYQEGMRFAVALIEARQRAHEARMVAVQKEGR